jgi:hypothetical protein
MVFSVMALSGIGEIAGMMGVIASPSEHALLREFSELRIPPWEFYHIDWQQEVLMCAGDGQVNERALSWVICEIASAREFYQIEEVPVRDALWETMNVAFDCQRRLRLCDPGTLLA